MCAREKYKKKLKVYYSKNGKQKNGGSLISHIEYNAQFLWAVLHSIKWKKVAIITLLYDAMMSLLRQIMHRRH